MLLQYPLSTVLCWQPWASYLVESNLLQLQSKWKPSNFNTIYSVKINYRGPKVGLCSKPFNLAAARKEIRFSQLTFVNWSFVMPTFLKFLASVRASSTLLSASKASTFVWNKPNKQDMVWLCLGNNQIKRSLAISNLHIPVQKTSNCFNCSPVVLST